jgi:hypothetical protein
VPGNGHSGGRSARPPWGQVVAALGVAGGNDLAGHSSFQEPLQGLVPDAPEVGGHTGPIQMHVHRQSGGGGMIRQAALLLAHLSQARTHPAQRFWHVHAQIAGLAQLLEIFLEEATFPVIDGGPLRTAGQDVVGQDAMIGDGCHTSPPSWVGLPAVTVGDKHSGKECTLLRAPPHPQT